jgi:hypothetical protein
MTCMLEGEGATLSEVAKQCIEQFGYRLLKSSTDENDLRFYIQVSTTERYRTQLLIDEASRILDLRVYCTDDQYPVSKCADVVELANRINEDVPFGLFYIQAGSGAIILKLAYDARSGATVEDIERWMNLCVFPTKVFTTAFDKIIQDDVDSEVAYSASLIMNSIHSDDVLTKTRRAMLRVVNGGMGETQRLDADPDTNLEIVMRELGLE